MHGRGATPEVVLTTFNKCLGESLHTGKAEATFLPMLLALCMALALPPVLFRRCMQKPDICGPLLLQRSAVLVASFVQRACPIIESGTTWSRRSATLKSLLGTDCTAVVCCANNTSVEPETRCMCHISEFCITAPTAHLFLQHALQRASGGICNDLPLI